MKRYAWMLLGISVLSVNGASAAGELAAAVEHHDSVRIQQLLATGVDVNEPQVDGATALHWAVQVQDAALVERLLKAGANATAANRVGATPLMLAAINGDAPILALLLDHGADVNAPLSVTGDTALMLAARTGLPEAVELLLQRGAIVDAREQWGGATALMWAVAEGHEPVVQRLIKAGADVNAVTAFIPRNTERSLQFEGSPPSQRDADARKPVMHASGELRPLHFAAREGHLAIAEQLLDAGADINARAADGKDAVGLAIFNGNYALASRLIEHGANVNQADAEEFTPLFWAVDRRNMETAPNFPWTVTDDPLPLVRQLLEAGADPNHLINATPKALMREGEPRLVFATALTRAAFSGDPDLVKLLLEFGADPQIRSSDDETMLSAAAGTGFIYGFHKLRPASDRLAVIRMLVERGLDVNWHDDYGITPLMAAANLGDTAIIQYLVDQGADLGAFDLGEKNDGVFGASIEPLMPIDYAIGVGTFRPNNAIVFNEPAVNLMLKLMQERGIVHRTSECTLRGFTCSAVNMDPRDATPADIARARAFQTGWQVDDNAKGSGLSVKPAQP
jgi:ankyrin repeat protein